MLPIQNRIFKPNMILIKHLTTDITAGFIQTIIRFVVKDIIVF